jgi:hypothetical protein
LKYVFNKQHFIKVFQQTSTKMYSDRCSEDDKYIELIAQIKKWIVVKHQDFIATNLNPYYHSQESQEPSLEKAIMSNLEQEYHISVSYVAIGDDSEPYSNTGGSYIVSGIYKFSTLPRLNIYYLSEQRLAQLNKWISAEQQIAQKIDNKVQLVKINPNEICFVDDTSCDEQLIIKLIKK